MWVLCVSSTAEGQMPYYKAKRKRSARGKSVRSETDVKFNCHFRQYEQVLVGLLCVSVCVLPQTFGPYHKIHTNN